MHRVNDTPFHLEQAIGMQVNRTAFLMAEEIARRFAAQGYPVSAQDFGIMFRLYEQGALTQIKLATLMMRDKTTITRRIDGLVKKALVKRIPHPDDRRYFHVILTDKGNTAMNILLPLVNDFQQEVLHGISDEHRNITMQTLQHISHLLIRHKQESA